MLNAGRALPINGRELCMRSKNVGWIALFVVLLTCGALSQFFWVYGLPRWITYLIRVGCLVFVAALFVRHAKQWAAKHDSPFEINNETTVPADDFVKLTHEKASDTLQEVYDELDQRFDFTDDSSVVVKSLSRQLTRPEDYRRRVHEHVQLEHRTILHNIVYHIPVARLGRSTGRETLVVLARPEKGSNSQSTALTDPSGAHVEMLRQRQSQAIVYGLVGIQVDANSNHDEATRQAIMTKVAGLICEVSIEDASPPRVVAAGPDQSPAKATNPPDQANANGHSLAAEAGTPAAPAPADVDGGRAKPATPAAALYREITGDSELPGKPSPPSRWMLWQLLAIAATRRPVMAVVDAPDRGELRLTLSHAETLKRVTRPSLKEDRWRKLTRHGRERVRLPPREIFLSARRARSALAYRLTFTAPPGSYVHFAHGYSYDKERWLPDSIDRDGLYRAFVGWTRPAGQTSASFGTRLLSETDVKEPFFYVRIAERLPGTAGVAVVVSFATMVVVWLCGAWPAAGVNDNVDVASLTLALPGVLAIWLGLSMDTGANSYRSIPGVSALIASAAISVTAIIVYMGISAHRLTYYTWHDGRDFFLVSSTWWSALLAAAMLNFAGVTLSFLIATFRYMRRLSE
jgi:hypothetical protein